MQWKLVSGVPGWFNWDWARASCGHGIPNCYIYICIYIYNIYYVKWAEGALMRDVPFSILTYCSNEMQWNSKTWSTNLMLTPSDFQCNLPARPSAGSMRGSSRACQAFLLPPIATGLRTGAFTEHASIYIYIYMCMLSAANECVAAYQCGPQWESTGRLLL